MTPDDMHIRRMTRDELDVLVEWAAREGWNPGLDDAEVFWDTDPDGFVAAEIGGELVGGGSVVALAPDTTVAEQVLSAWQKDGFSGFVTSVLGTDRVAKRSTLVEEERA